jgi:hypothetical protein
MIQRTRKKFIINTIIPQNQELKVTGTFTAA